MVESWTGLGWKDPEARPVPPLPWQGHLPLSPVSSLAWDPAGTEPGHLPEGQSPWPPDVQLG